MFFVCFPLQGNTLNLPKGVTVVPDELFGPAIEDGDPENRCSVTRIERDVLLQIFFSVISREKFCSSQWDGEDLWSNLFTILFIFLFLNFIQILFFRQICHYHTKNVYLI